MDGNNAESCIESVVQLDSTVDYTKFDSRCEKRRYSDVNLILYID